MISGRTRQYLVTLAVSVSAVAVGFLLAWPTPVIPKFYNNETGFHISETGVSWLAAMGSPGFMAGSLVCRYLSERSGRRLIILGSALPMIIGTIIMLNSTKAWLICLAKFVWGVASGLTRTVAGMYISEISDKEIRGRLLATDRFMFSLGTFVCMVVGPFVSYHALNYISLFLPICDFVACVFIPESPYFLIKQGNVNAARKVLKKLSGNNDENALEDKLSGIRADISKEMLRSGSVKEVFTKQYRKIMNIVVGVMVTQIMVGFIAIQQYSGAIIQESKADINLSTALTVFATIRFIIGMVTIVTVDLVGRRPLIMYSHFFSAIVLIIMAIYFFLDPVSSKIYRFIPFAGLIIISILSTGGTTTYVLIAEIFPINIKSVGMTLANILGGVFSFICSKSYQPVKDISGLTGVFILYAIFGLIGAVFTYFIVPETKGKSLREIQIELQGNIYDDDDQKVDRELETLKNGKNINETLSDLEKNEASSNLRKNDTID